MFPRGSTRVRYVDVQLDVRLSNWIMPFIIYGPGPCPSPCLSLCVAEFVQLNRRGLPKKLDLFTTGKDIQKQETGCIILRSCI